MPSANAVVTVSVRKIFSNHFSRAPSGKSTFFRKYFGIGILLLIAAIPILHIGLRHRVIAPRNSDYKTLNLQSQTFKVQVADTSYSREHGLSGQPSLMDNDGMLFIFAFPDKACFWMKDMRFNIDILWFDAQKRLIDQQRNLSPDTFPRSYCPDKPSQYVLELKAGSAARLDLKMGDEFRLKNQ